ncbi:MAG TPA: hybrid sensor histidine kinase/response regulator, partial [Opitutaceae bacterium]|nr:hybrid sensor histidine kinase/response regulator [Opitutaceae bacterium]
RTGMNLGADDYLQKPFAIEEFIRSVKTRFRRAEFARKADARAIAKLKGTVTKQLPHELLTPLSGILGLSEVLLEDFQSNAPADNHEMLRDIHRSAERLHHTLKNYFRILEVLDEGDEAEREEGTVVAQESSIVLAETARHIAQKFGRLQDLQVFAGNLALPLSRTNFASILGELVDNAFKYSHPGTPVEVELRRQDEHLNLRVTDRGRGMSPEQIGQIGAFRQFDRTKYEQQGLGLGLTLTQHVIERTGGTFVLESAPGAGTEVRVTWPLPMIT